VISSRGGSGRSGGLIAVLDYVSGTTQCYRHDVLDEVYKGRENTLLCYSPPNSTPDTTAPSIAIVEPVEGGHL
jgi:hypothetical protein